MKKYIKHIASILFLLSSLVVISCDTELIERGTNSVEYGSVIVNQNRAIDIDDLTTAFVSMTGYDMDDLSQTVSIAGGTGSFTFEKVPVGNNRIITVKSNVDGIQMRAIVDVLPGKTSTVNVTWKTTALGNVFYYLNKNKVNISEYTSEDVEKITQIIPSTVHAVLVDAESIAKDYAANGEGSDGASYIISKEAVSVSSTGCNGYKVQITDPVSSVYTVSSSSGTIEAAPGTWKVKVIDSTGTVVDTKSITVASGKQATISLVKQADNPTSYIEIYVPTNNSAGYKYVYTWNNSTVYTGAWPGTAMTASGSYYVQKIPATSTSVILNTGSGAQTSDLSISSAGRWLWNDTTRKIEPYSLGEGSLVVTISYSGNDDPDPSVFKIYVSANVAPKIWAWSKSATNVTSGSDWNNRPTMTAATGMSDGSKWYETTLSAEKLVPGEEVSFIVYEGSVATSDIPSGMSSTFWYDALGIGVDGVKGKIYSSDPSVPPTPEAPKYKISEKAYLGETFEIEITSLEALTQSTVSINGISKALHIGRNTLNVSDFTTTAKTLTVSGTLTNATGSTIVSGSIVVEERPITQIVSDPNELRIYQVMVSSFQDGDPSRGFTRAYGPSNATKGGDLQGIINAADYIKDLGCNAIWMTPIFESNGTGEMDSTGYFAYDYFNIDDQFGTNEKFAELVDVYHSKGMAVILDGVFGHNKGYVAASPNRKGINNPGITPDTNNPVNYATNSNSLKYYSDVARYWITEYKIDGWRFDQCYQLAGGEYNSGKNCNTGGMNYWYDIRKVVEAAAASNGTKGQDWGTLGYMVGEDWDGNQQSLQASVVSPRGSAGYGLNSCFDFPAYYYVVQGFAQEWDGKTTSNITSGLSYLYKTYSEKGYVCKEDDGTYETYYPNFMLTNHDLYRIGDLIQKKFSCGYDNDQYVNRNKVLIAAQCAYSGPITIYYGDEIAARSADNSNGSGWYPDNVARSSGKISGFNKWEQNVHDFTKKCLDARSQHKALWSGTNTQVVGEQNFYVAKKVGGGETIYIAFNYGTSEKSFTISGSGTDLLTGNEFSGSVKVPALSARYVLIK